MCRHFLCKLREETHNSSLNILNYTMTSPVRPLVCAGVIVRQPGGAPAAQLDVVQEECSLPVRQSPHHLLVLRPGNLPGLQ